MEKAIWQQVLGIHHTLHYDHQYWACVVDALHLVQEGILNALAILCEHHPDARGKFAGRASIGQLARELYCSDVKVLFVLCC